MRIRIGIRTLAIVFAGCAFAVTAGAQSTTTSSTPSGSSATTSTSQPAPKPGTYAERKNRQQNRIAQGVDSGQLTAGETQHLEKWEAAESKEAQAMRAQDNGKLTATDRAKLNQQQNKTSQQIYADKHNANTGHYGNNQVGQRRENQQDRIAQGIKSGSLTAGEASHLEGQEKNLNKQIASDRAANGGTLTPAEKQQINKEQNQESKKIYNKKHNSATRKKP
jgi:hypothetical protein